jgi:hypothetical protein
VAEIEGITTSNSHRGRYNKPKRDLKQREIRRLIIQEGLSNQQISDRLGVPLKTVERWVTDIYGRDRKAQDFLYGVDQVFEFCNILKERLEYRRQYVESNIAYNSQASHADQMKAIDMANNIDATILRLMVETAPELVRHAVQDVKNILILKQKEEEEQKNNEVVKALPFDIDIDPKLIPSLLDNGNGKGEQQQQCTKLQRY